MACWVACVMLVGSSGLILGVSGDGENGLDKGFKSPPAAARPWVYCFWMDGNLSREGITADLEAMQRAGIGGVLIMEVDVGIPKGPVKFMGPEWRQLFKHVVREAERLGLQITLNAGPGWTGSGGPWVKPEQSMQHLVSSATEVTGPKYFDENLSIPLRRPAFFGDGALPPALEQAKNEFYRDVVVLAFPTPAQKRRLADIDEKADYVRAPYSSQPGVKASLAAPAHFQEWPKGAVIPVDRVVDLSAHLTAQGRLTWDVPAGNWTILRFGRTSNGANTRPAPSAGLGLECDKLDPTALDAHFEAFIGTLLREIGPRRNDGEAGWNMLHIDSWEMGAQNWTGAFRQEFQRRRGYDLWRYLPVITGRVVDSVEVSERFLWDVRQTVQELIVENHAEHLKTLGHQSGFGLSIEPYDMTPCADMSLGGVADVPMCEFWLYGFNTSFSVIEATSIAHTCGRPIVAAESFTSTDAERWLAHPASMKSLGDWAFSAGVNRFVFHRYQHQPWLDRWPGMTMGPYGVHWERTQTWWPMVPAYHEYLSRCQFLLRQGLPVADVCYVVAEGSPQVFRPPPSATTGNPPERLGYNFDGCAPETLISRMSVENGRLRLPDGMSYRVLVLPERETMTPALLRKFKELVEAGATVIGPRPIKSPSLSGFPQCDEDVRVLAGEIWGDCDGVSVREHPFGKGRVVWQRTPAAELGGDEPEALERASWIWHKEGNPATSAPVGKRFFRRIINLDAKARIQSARVTMTADNSFEMWVNGRRAGAGDNFHQAFVLDVASLLRPGTNIVAVAAENGGDTPNPAGLIGMLVLRYDNGQMLEMPTDRQWQSARSTNGNWLTASFSAGAWDLAMELGPYGMAPWGRTSQSAAEPDQYGDFSIVTKVLQQMGVAADFSTDGPLRYTHRRVGGQELYFVANRDDRPVEAACAFRVAGKAPELWDPLTGQIRDLPAFSEKEGQTTVAMRFAPTQSFFVIFRKPSINAPAANLNFPDIEPGEPLLGPWEVSFDPKWGGPAATSFSILQDWSKRPEDGIKYYSGMATYRKTFDLPASLRVFFDRVQGADSTSRAATDRRVWLDLGAVKNLARVRLNGEDLGVLWCAPWRVEITKVVRAKENHLEIDVANLWPNRLIGDQLLPPEKRLAWTTWNPFKKDTPLLESGLLGPVRLETRVSH
jgi:hypothetical protein